MRTRNSNFPNNSNVTIPRRRNKGRAPNIVEPELRTIVAPMAERTMEELLRAPTEGYGEAIVLPEINADHFEIKTNLLQLVQANPFHGLENENPHAHINSFKRITSTLRFRNVPNDVIKLMMFPYSLEGAAKTCEAWERFKEMLRACPHHGFTELTQIDTFYNGLNDNDQDSLNAAAGGNLLSKTTREALNIIENKSKVRYSRNKPNASRMNTTSREGVSKTDERIDKLADQLSTLVEIVSKKVVTPAPVKAVEETCVTCGGAHSWYNCPTTDNNQASVCATTGTYNQVNPPNRVSNQMAPPGFAPVQNNGQNRVEMKAITTRSGVAYEGPSIPTNLSSKKESMFHSNKIPQVSLVFAITSTLPSIEPMDSLIMGDEHLSTFSAEEIVPIPREFEDTPMSDRGYNEEIDGFLLSKFLVLLRKYAVKYITIPPEQLESTEDNISRCHYMRNSSSVAGKYSLITIQRVTSHLTTLVKDSDFNREEIDIFSGPDDSIPPGIESDFDSEEDIIDNLLNDDPI
ncbi:reverse transcriptase domain-containing protein [Tanacetum coccineum]